jgi:hypothetical protein
MSRNKLALLLRGFFGGSFPIEKLKENFSRKLFLSGNSVCNRGSSWAPRNAHLSVKEEEEEEAKRNSSKDELPIIGKKRFDKLLWPCALWENGGKLYAPSCA